MAKTTSFYGQSNTWWFDVAPRKDASVKPFRFYVVDSGNDRNALKYEAFKAAAGPEREKIWITHIPPAMLLRYGGHHHYADKSIMTAVTTALREAPNCVAFSCWPRAILTGHQHLYQKVELSTSVSIGPGTIVTEVHIAGNGGTAWDTGGAHARGNSGKHGARCHRTLRAATHLPSPSDPTPFAEVFGPMDLHARITSASRHGYLSMVRDAASQGVQPGWVMTPKWTPGDPVIRLPATAHGCE